MPLVAFWDSPTAQMSVAETMATPNRRLVCVLGLGLETVLHCLPFQCSMRVCETPLALEAFPTAHTSLVATAATACSSVPTVEGFFTTLHLWPLQCSISACPPPLVGRKEPTAHTSLVATAATPRRLPSTMPVVGLATMLHTVPSQCRMSVWSLPRVFSLVPTAQTSLAEMLATAWSSLFPGVALGLATTLQAAACATAGDSSRASSTAATTQTKRWIFKCFMIFLTISRSLQRTGHSSAGQPTPLWRSHRRLPVRWSCPRSDSLPHFQPVYHYSCIL